MGPLISAFIATKSFICDIFTTARNKDNNQKKEELSFVINFHGFIDLKLLKIFF